ncbi:MAG: GNAT family N-acetyltransferase [Rhodoferax sp.]|nr:GNAT family N-acetyltransferase [Rhodoferax sp.]
MKSDSNDYVIRVFSSPLEVPAADWNALLACQVEANPFMRHEYLTALHQSGSATPQTGWTPRFVTLWRGPALAAACALYLKDHSYGEYVFDWAWANAYEQHGLSYYPKAVVASPFTPVPGARLLARDAPARQALVKALVNWCGEQKLSSLHLLFAGEDDVATCAQAGLMLRHTVQFHWKNVAPTLVASRTALDESPPDATTLRPVQARAGGLGAADLSPEEAELARGGPSLRSTAPTLAAGPFGSFEDFLASLSHEKRKKIRQERRKVADAGVSFRWSLGRDIAPRDWDFFYRCYERTYYEHGNAPYLSRDFFLRMADTMPENWLLFVAQRNGQPIATSLIAVSAGSTGAAGPFDANTARDAARPVAERVAYGRYWGALERVDCLHFEACYYQPLKWCIEHGFQRFEGGAQGEHKMARALLPVKTTSAHWLAHPAFADAVERFLAREGQGIEHYMDELERRNPFKHVGAPS